MHIQRIQVPNFRVLQNVDITFEKDFMPRIFPLGSLNGGGKSTLLQLVFILLHCSAHEDRKRYIQNLLDGFDVPEGETTRELAKFDIWDGEETIELVFSVCNDAFLNKLSETYNEKFKFNIFERERTLKRKELDIPELREKFQEIQERLQEARKNPERRVGSYSVRMLEKKYTEANFELERYEQETINFPSTHVEKIIDYLQSQGQLFISDCLGISDTDYKALVCSSNEDISDLSTITNILQQISSRIHLAAPSSHVYLFFSEKEKGTLFKQDTWNDYASVLQIAKKQLPNFFIHNFLLSDALLKTFQYARDQDFEQAIETGQYGSYYTDLLKDLSCLLGNKKITPSPKLDRIVVKLETPQGDVELGPEDLSHGEIKKLSIYVWLKYIVGENAIVLVDEIENTLHPDWQYQVVDSLKEWGPNNQYILATHSYDVCQALTPAHVKELEPKLLKNNPQE